MYLKTYTIKLKITTTSWLHLQFCRFIIDSSHCLVVVVFFTPSQHIFPVTFCGNNANVCFVLDRYTKFDLLYY